MLVSSAGKVRGEWQRHAESLCPLRALDVAGDGGQQAADEPQTWRQATLQQRMKLQGTCFHEDKLNCSFTFIANSSTSMAHPLPPDSSLSARRLGSRTT